MTIRNGRVATGVAAVFMLGTAASSANAAGIFDFLLPASAPVQEGRSVATSPEEAELSRPAALTTRVIVKDPTEAAPGTVTIDTKNRYLYLSMPEGEAMRYDIGVGREGFTWSGTAFVARRAEWPSWTPPAAMLKRRPDIPHFMKGGIDNPLGARALYLYNGKGDTGFRIHGTNEPDSIGQAVSSGCIRLMNQDVIDLYGRVKVGTKVVVLPG